MPLLNHWLHQLHMQDAYLGHPCGSRHPCEDGKHPGLPPTKTVRFNIGDGLQELTKLWTRDGLGFAAGCHKLGKPGEDTTKVTKGEAPDVNPLTTCLATWSFCLMDDTLSGRYCGWMVVALRGEILTFCVFVGQLGIRGNFFPSAFI